MFFRGDFWWDPPGFTAFALDAPEDCPDGGCGGETFFIGMEQPGIFGFPRKVPQIANQLFGELR
ncbi:MAG: hypothetical protein LBH14_04160 [Desulfobulbaceae bacterium]|jgi:hypothetical protein|nr:hypothetical protein [Desulfobulbaceae bacterium]